MSNRHDTRDQSAENPWAFGYVADLWSKPVTSEQYLCNVPAGLHSKGGLCMVDLRVDDDPADAFDDVVDRWLLFILDRPSQGPAAMSSILIDIFKKVTYAELLWGYSGAEQVERLAVYAQSGARCALIVTELPHKRAWARFLKQHTSAFDAVAIDLGRRQ